MSLRFAGYAALFDRRDCGHDLIRPGAFARSLASRTAPLPLLWQHNANRRIGWIQQAREDARGLTVIARLDDQASGAARALRRGAANGLSFGYRASAFTLGANGRTLIALDLFEISLVTHPMQPAARVHLVAPCPLISPVPVSRLDGAGSVHCER